MKTITSRDNPFFKQLRSLAEDPREQRRKGLTVLDGPHLVGTYLSRRGLPRHLLVSESGLQHAEVGSLVEAHRRSDAAFDMLCLRDSLFREISGTQSPVGIAAVIEIPVQASSPRLTGDCVVLDGVQDAGNVGSIMRTAAAAGIATVVLGQGCAGPWTPRVLRAAQGAHFSLTIVEHPALAELLIGFEGHSYAAVAHQGRPLYDEKILSPYVWVFGSEGQGISTDVLACCVNAVTIPMASQSESLNVAAAAAICIYEGVRQTLPASGSGGA